MTATKNLTGFLADRVRGGAPNNGAINQYKINPAGYGVDIYQGDLVTRGTNGYLARVSVSTDRILGVFQGVQYNDPVTKRPTWSKRYAANTSVGTDPAGITADVVDLPTRTYTVQADGSVSAGDVGYNFDVTLGAGNANTNQSGMGLQAGSRRTTLGPVRVISIVQTPDNAPSDAFTQVEVQLVNTFDAFTSAF